MASTPVETAPAQAAEGITSGIVAGDWTAAEVLEPYLERADRHDGAVRAFVRRSQESARERADGIDQRRSRGERLGPLAGVPVAIKDNISIAGRALTCGSRILDGYTSPYSATAIERLLDADAVLVGQTNMDEFAMGSSCENSAFFATRNPWSPSRVPGGSSGGSAAAVAARFAAIALGSDTGGSVRQPAAFCGMVGLKPSYGRISRSGLVAFASSLDQIGPITPTVRDAAISLGVLSGHDPRDATSSRQPVDDYLQGIEDGVSGLRIGVVREVGMDRLDDELGGVFRQALDRLTEAGAEVVDVSVPTIEAAIAIYYVVANCEASANLARFDGVRYGFRDPDSRSLEELYSRSRSHGFGAEVKRRILLGTFALSSGYYDAYYGRALEVLAALRQELESAFGVVDLIATPTAPGAAFALGDRTEDPLQMYLSDVYTTPASLVGLPALAVPSGVDADGLPLSFQLMGRPFEESLLLRAGRSLERALRTTREAEVQWPPEWPPEWPPKGPSDAIREVSE